MKVIVTDGAGDRLSGLIGETAWSVVNLDKLTYGAKLSPLESIDKDQTLPLRAGRHRCRAFVRSVFDPGTARRGSKPYR